MHEAQGRSTAQSAKAGDPPRHLSRPHPDRAEALILLATEFKHLQDGNNDAIPAPANESGRGRSREIRRGKGAATRLRQSRETEDKGDPGKSGGAVVGAPPGPPLLCHDLPTGIGWQAGRAEASVAQLAPF